jgi:hypothetical protein
MIDPLVNGTFYLSPFVKDTFYSAFFSCFYQVYLKDHWMLNLWCIREILIFNEVAYTERSISIDVNTSPFRRKEMATK